ncbi:MAG: succinylglutamate desuccinylase/aspartoacylase family protein [Bacteriovoracaceae bacterium]
MSWTIKDIPVKELSTGEVLSVKTYTLQNGAGPHVHIQASVHGAEIQGNAVILKLMEALKHQEIQGSITLIPLANPYATLNKHGTYTYGRYNPVTGDNWNRNYLDIVKACAFDLKSFCERHKDHSWDDVKRAYKKELGQAFAGHVQDLKENNRLQDNNKINILLQELALGADGVLDLHTGPTATRYLYSAEYEEEISKHLLFKHVLVIPDEYAGAMDEASFMPWIHLKRHMKELGRKIDLDIESFTLEFGSEETFRMDEGSKDVESILNYLRYKNILPGDPISQDAYYSKLENYKTVFAPRGGLVDYHLQPGDHFNKGEKLATFYQMKAIDPEDPVKSCSHDLFATMDGIIINRCPSSNVHQGMELFQIMSSVYKAKA